MKQLWWLSFCDGGRPKGKQFLGVSVLDFDQPVTAEVLAPTAWARGCNPGGEIVLLELPPSADLATPAEYRNRLLSRDEVEALEVIHGAYVLEHGYDVEERPDTTEICEHENETAKAEKA